MTSNETILKKKHWESITNFKNQWKAMTKQWKAIRTKNNLEKQWNCFRTNEKLYKKMEQQGNDRHNTEKSGKKTS